MGQSKDVRRRLANDHRIRVEYVADRGLVVFTPWGQFDVRGEGGVSVKVRASSRRGDWLMHEQRMIRRLRPQFNREVRV